jgi:nucleotide-binding universal stress UspA family protein
MADAAQKPTSPSSASPSASALAEGAGRQETIVVGVDLTASGLRALEAALDRAHHPAAVVHVVYALDLPDHQSSAGGMERAEKALSEGAARLTDHLNQAQALAVFGRGVQAHVRLESPVDAVLQLAVDVEADLIVVGTEKRHGLNELLHSSVGGTIAHLATCPVLVARPKDHREQSKSPRVMPLCTACRDLRIRTENPNAWCEQHAAERHFARHTYSYHREQSLRTPAPEGQMLI